jgi:hypothetical protein
MDAGFQNGFAVIATAVQVGIGLVFVSAGVGKLKGWHEFKGMLGAYHLLPSQWVTVAAAVIVTAEIVTACGLIASWNARVFSLLAGGLLASFATAIGINLVRGRRFIDCGCFQSTRQPIEWRLVVRNVLCAAAVLASSAVSMPFHEPQRWMQAAPAGAALFAIYIALNGVWALDASRSVAFTRS